MAIEPVPAAFTTIGTDVVMVGTSYSFDDGELTPGKIVKVTKTQVTAEFTRGGRTQTVRFVAARFRDNRTTQMDEYGMRDSWRRGATLLLPSDPSIARRKAAKVAKAATNDVRNAANAFHSIAKPTAENVATLQAALDTYKEFLTKQ